MRKPHALFLVSVCSLLLPLAPAGAWARGTSSITNMPTLGGSSFQIYGLNQAGQITGFSYTSGDLAAHAFRFSNGVTTDLGTLGGTISQGFAINSSGQVAGEANTSGDAQTHATLWTGTNATNLGTLGGSYSSASALNDAGQVVGTSLTAGDTANRAFLYSGGTIHDLGSLGGGSSQAAAINQSGVVVGDAVTAAFQDHAFLYTNGVMMNLGTLGGTYSAAFAINDSGVVAGESYLANDSQTRGFVYAGGSMQSVGTLGGTYSTASAVNNTGQVIGMSTTAGDAHTHGFVYASGTLTDLGTLGGDDTVPYANNNLGKVVGYSITSNSAAHAFLWQNGTITDLNTLLPANSGWELMVAQFINDSGRIVGVGIYQGNTLPFVMDLGSANHDPVANAGLDQTAQCSASVILDGSGSSDPDGDALTYQWSSGASVLGTSVTLTTTFPLGTNVVTLTVTDPSGASSQDTVVVTVEDTTRPVIVSGPALSPVSADAGCQGAVPSVTSQIVATDNCTPANQLVISQSPQAGTLVGLGQQTIIVTVSDASGNSTNGSLTFSVVDSTAPTILSAPGSVTVSADANCQGAVPNVVSQVVASDNCTPANALVISQNPQAGTLVSSGSHTITVTVTDAAGNSASRNIPFTVADTTAPIFQSLSVTPNVLSPPNHQMVPVTVSATVSDNCDSAPLTKIVSITSSEAASAGDIQITGNLTATLAATRNASGSGRVYTITVRSTDSSGNSSNATVTVTVPKGNGNKP